MNNMHKEALLTQIGKLEDRIEKKCLCHNDKTLLKLIHELVETNLELEQVCNE